jgi:hypothetical protein
MLDLWSKDHGLKTDQIHFSFSVFLTYEKSQNLEVDKQ